MLVLSNLGVGGQEGSPAVLVGLLLQQQEVLDPVDGHLGLAKHADREGEEERHGEAHRIVQGQRQKGLFRGQHLWRR